MFFENAYQFSKAKSTRSGFVSPYKALVSVYKKGLYIFGPVFTCPKSKQLEIIDSRVSVKVNESKLKVVKVTLRKILKKRSQRLFVLKSADLWFGNL